MRQKVLCAALAWLVATGTAMAAISTAESERLQKAADVVRALRDQPDNGIPDKLWDRAACVVIIPGVKKPPSASAASSGAG